MLVLAALFMSAAGCGPGLSTRASRTLPRARARGPAAVPHVSEDFAASSSPERPPQPFNFAAPFEAETVDPAAPFGLTAPFDPSRPIDQAPAARYAAFDRLTCEAELDRRNIPYERVEEARGVIAPLRLKGRIAGIDFHSMLPQAQRRTSPYEIYDCRLVLAIDDWARVLARHDVVEVVHYSVYRPPHGKEVVDGAARRHGGALAIDAAMFKTSDGRLLSVERDFHGRIGSRPCAPSARNPVLPPEATTLRQIVCEAADAQLFNVLLTPDYNWPHRNHFHLEVTAGARWVMVR